VKKQVQLLKRWNYCKTHSVAQDQITKSFYDRSSYSLYLYIK